jgi:LPXTG-motif cell wall-anchored protein
MTSTLIQYGIWLAAGAALLFFLKRRRSRKSV